MMKTGGPDEEELDESWPASWLEEEVGEAEPPVPVLVPVVV